MSTTQAPEFPLDKLTLLDEAQSELDNDKKVYRIGDLAREFAVTLRTLRFYEDRGLITPRRSGSTRLYSSQDRTRLKMILLAKRVGFSLVDIHEIMDVYDLGATSDTHLKTVLAKFRSQMSVLEEQKEELISSMDELRDTIQTLEDMV